SGFSLNRTQLPIALRLVSFKASCWRASYDVSDQKAFTGGEGSRAKVITYRWGPLSDSISLAICWVSSSVSVLSLTRVFIRPTLRIRKADWYQDKSFAECEFFRDHPKFVGLIFTSLQLIIEM